MAEFFAAGAHPLNHAPEVHRLVTCKRCGDDKLCWCRSARTGKWYLANVQKIDRNVTAASPDAYRWFALAMQPHTCA